MQRVVVHLIQSGLYVQPEPSAVLNALNKGVMEAFWVLEPDGRQAGLFACQTGNIPELRQRVFYVASAAVSPHVSEAGWARLIEQGRMLARERGCQLLQFETIAENKRVVQVGRLAGARESVRFTLEV